MNKFIGITILLVVLVGGYVVYSNSIAVKNQNSTASNAQPTGQQAAIEAQNASTKEGTISDMQEDKKMMDSNKMIGDTPADNKMMTSAYTEYSKEKYEAAIGKQRVLFFHAAWCPTCKAANTEFEANLNKIPTDVVLFKTDYDTEKELKAKYNITYQHTFVLVDQNDKEIKKWNGGGIAELTENTKI